MAGKQLLKLVNKQQQPRRLWRTGRRLAAQCLFEAGLRRGTRSQHLRGQLWAKLWQKSRLHQRRLARARGANHQHKPLLAQVLLQPGDLGAASEKPAGLVFGKRHQARIRTARLHQLQVGQALALQARQHRGNWARKQRSRDRAAFAIQGRPAQKSRYRAIDDDRGPREAADRRSGSCRSFGREQLQCALTPDLRLGGTDLARDIKTVGLGLGKAAAAPGHMSVA